MSILNELLNEINKKVNRIVNEEFCEVTAEEVGLDIRSVDNVFINPDYIAVFKDKRRSLDYYGGFEYVEEEHVTVLGDFVFYSADDERVQGHLDEFFNLEKQEL